MSRRPNVLVLMSDEQSWDTMGNTGNPAASTPHLDELAGRGVSFDRCYTPFPLCCPSRASLWTARAPRHHHVLGNWQAIRPELRTSSVASAFAAAGYHTAYAGKWHVPGTTPELMGFRACAAIPAVLDGRDRGRFIEPYRSYVTRQGYELLPDHIENLTRDDLAGLHDPAAPHRSTAAIQLEHYLETWQTGEFLGMLDRRPDDRPWFAVCSYNAPHFPMVVPSPYDKRIDRSAVRLPTSFTTGLASRPREVRESPFATGFTGMNETDWTEVIAHYLGLVSLVDAQVGRVIEYLESAGELDSTIVVFTSDHGDMMGAHQLMEKGHVLHYEEALRVPLMIAHPDAGAGRCDRLLSVVDVAPTLAGLAGVPWDDDHDGRSFADLVSRPAGAPLREYVTSESALYGMSSDARGDHVDPACWSADTDGFNASIRTNNARYTFRSRDEDELFDLDADPAEQHNLGSAGDYAALRTELRQVLAGEIRDVFPQVAAMLTPTALHLDSQHPR